MAQDLQYLNKEYWGNEMQKTLFVENTAVFLAGTEAAAVLAKDGRKFHKPILSHPVTGTYSPTAEISDEDLTSTDEELEVDTFKYASVYIDDTQKKQNFYNAADMAAMSMQKQLNNLVEQAFLNRVKDDAVHTIDAANVGGAAGSNIELLASNATKIFTAGHTKLDTVDAPFATRVAVVGPHSVGVLREVKASRESMLGDQVLANGIIGPWQGWTVVQNNNLPWTATLTIAAQPTDGDTVTIAGITFTFKDDISSGTAGFVDIGGSAANARTNLSYAILGTGTVGTNYNDVSSENRFIIQKRNLSCTTAEAMAFTGNGDIVVAETFNSGSNLWSAQTQYSWFGLRGATDLALQMPASVEVVRVEKRFGDRIKSLEGFGVKTFADGAMGLIAVKLDASVWV
jgi:hypothetical protein